MPDRRALLTVLSLAAMPRPAWSEPFSVRAADGVVVAADLRRAAAPRRGTILLFHMAGDNRGEYDPIAPRLNAAGFDTIATDQRSGGTAHGRRNETAERVGRDPGYAAALPDLEAALAQARGQGGRVAVWGSSYSAALAFVLAARHPGEVACVLAFSPGEYIGGTSIRAAAARVACPVFVTSASDRGEEQAAAAILAASPAVLKRQHRAASRLHGSASLGPANRAGAEDNWKAVLAFLDAAMPREG